MSAPAAKPVPSYSPLVEHWGLDRSITFLNHGSFGATPLRVLARQVELQRRLESEPVRFLVEELEPLLDGSRRALAELLRADAGGFAFVPNATAGVNAVLRSLNLSPGDEIVLLNQAYNACANAVRFVAERSGAKVVLADLPWPVQSPEQAVQAVVKAISPRTRLAMIDHITSPSALVLPIEEIVRQVQAKGVDVLVDGAHGPGMVDVQLDDLGAAYYTANCHKWLCAPKGAAFLWVRQDRRAATRPLIISHGANSRRTDRSRFLLEFDWCGTCDYSPWVCIADSIHAIADIARGPGGLRDVWTDWARVRTHNRELALRARRLLSGRFGTPPMAPEEMIGSIATVALPDGVGPEPPLAAYPSPLQRALIDRHRIQVPIGHFPAWPKRTLRISAQLYNDFSQYEHLANVLGAELGIR